MMYVSNCSTTDYTVVTRTDTAKLNKFYLILYFFFSKEFAKVVRVVLALTHFWLSPLSRWWRRIRSGFTGT